MGRIGGESAELLKRLFEARERCVKHSGQLPEFVIGIVVR